jgi:hypothetical protein
MGRKASQEDLKYYKKELGFKLDKSEIEQFKTEFIERISLNETKLNDKMSTVKGLKETVESTEANFRHFKALVEARVDGKSDICDV